MATTGGRMRKTPFQKLYAKGQGSSFPVYKTNPETGEREFVEWRGVVTYKDQKGAQKRKAFAARTEREVRDKMRDWIAGGGVKRIKEWRVEDLFEELLKEGGRFEREKRQKPNTIYDYRSQWRRLVKPEIGRMKLAEVGPVHLDDLLTAIQNDPENPRSPRTVLNVRRMVAIVFKEGERMGYVSNNPARLMRQVKVEKYRASIYDRQHIERLITTTEGKPIQLAIMLAGICGLRQGEIAGLMHSDFDPTTRVLKIVRQVRQVRGGGPLDIGRPKTDAGTRTITVPPFVADAITATPKTSLYVFPNPRDERLPIHPTMLNKNARAAMVEAGLPVIRFHDLRHSANNILKQLGVQPTTRRDILGHSTVAVTENIYTQTVSAEIVDAMDVLGKAYSTSRLTTAEEAGA